MHKLTIWKLSAAKVFYPTHPLLAARRGPKFQIVVVVVEEEEEEVVVEVEQVGGGGGGGQQHQQRLVE